MQAYLGIASTIQANVFKQCEGSIKVVQAVVSCTDDKALRGMAGRFRWVLRRLKLVNLTV